MYSPARPKSFTSRLVQVAIFLAMIAAQVAFAWAIAERFGVAAGLTLIAGVALGMMTSSLTARAFRKTQPRITGDMSIGFTPLRWNKAEDGRIELHDLKLHYVSMDASPYRLVADDPPAVGHLSHSVDDGDSVLGLVTRMNRTGVAIEVEVERSKRSTVSTGESAVDEPVRSGDTGPSESQDGRRR